MEFNRRKAATLATMNSPEPDKSPKGNVDEPIIPLLNLLNSHPSYFTTSSCSGRISIFSHPVDPTNSKKKAKGGTWLFISHEHPVDPTSVLPLLFPPIPLDPTTATTNELVFKFEPLIIAVECRDVLAASSLVSLAISCGFRESGITSVSKKRVIIAIRCSIRMELPLGDTRKVMVSPEYLEYLIRVANEKMEANKKRTDLLYEALVKNGYGKVANGIGNGNTEVECDNEDNSECLNGGKMESMGDCLSSDDERKDLNDSGSSVLADLKLSMSRIGISGEPVDRLFLWGHSACPISDDNHTKILIFGGFGGIGRHARRNDLLLLDPIGGKTQAINVTESPCPRLGHTSTVVGDSMYVVGGRADPLNILGDVWQFKFGAKEWSLLQISGSQFNPRHRHAAAAIGAKIYIFGGVDNGVILSSLHVIDTQKLQCDEIPTQGEWPSPRHSHSMVAYSNHLYMFGGCNGEKALGDLYIFDVQTCKWKKVNVAGREPPARFSHSMFVHNHYLGIVGGCPVSKHHKELSLLDLNSSVWMHFMINSSDSNLFVRSTANIIGHELVMIGGGASCYAFGTKFSEPAKINLLPVESLANTLLFVKNSEGRLNSRKPESTDKRRLFRNGNVNPNTDVEVANGSIAHELVSSYWVLRLERKYAKFGKDILKKFGWLDLARKVCSQDDGKYIYFPVHNSFCTLFKDTTTEELANPHAEQPFDPERVLVKDISESAALDYLSACGATKLEDKAIKVKRAPVSPLQAMKEAVTSLVRESGLPLDLLEELPSRWQRLGDIAVLPVRSFKSPAWDAVAKELWPVVACSIGASRLARQGPVASTGTRDSTLEILVGDNGWVEHRENGILYSFDATKCMFSWGNLSEKLRMANLNCRDEIIVDLFAGIGYFTLPFLTRAGAKLVYACEWNPHAVEALSRNVSINGVADQCIILEGDNRVTAPKGLAHRVCLGLLPTSEGSWLTAVRALRSDGGVMHIHGNVKDTEESCWTEHVSQSIRDIATSEGYSWEVSVIRVERVKWYAPHIRHVVLDVQCRKVRDVKCD